MNNFFELNYFSKKDEKEILNKGPIPSFKEIRFKESPDWHNKLFYHEIYFCIIF